MEKLISYHKKVLDVDYNYRNNNDKEKKNIKNSTAETVNVL